jgi:hypothetical protein
MLKSEILTLASPVSQTLSSRQADSRLINANNLLIETLHLIKTTLGSSWQEWHHRELISSPPDYWCSDFRAPDFCLRPFSLTAMISGELSSRSLCCLTAIHLAFFVA